MHVLIRIRSYAYVKVTIEIQDTSTEYGHDPKTNKVNEVHILLFQILYILIYREKLSTNGSCSSISDHLDGWEDRFEVPRHQVMAQLNLGYITESVEHHIVQEVLYHSTEKTVLTKSLFLKL